MLLAFDTNISDLSEKEFEKNTSETAIPCKEKILGYMKKFDPCAFTTQPVYDRITGEKVVKADNEHSDGEYSWYESDIYHFEKYNLKLNDDFIQHVLSK